MKRILFSPLALSSLVALGLVTSVGAQSVSFTFDSNAQNFLNFSWSSTGPAGSPGGACLQAPATVGGWTLGGSYNYYHEFDWVSGQQPVMQSIVASGLGRVSFDLMVDGTSFTPGVSGWYNMEVAGNSAGAHGWTQVGDIFGAGPWHNADDATLYMTHVDLSFAQVGWADPEDATGWFQLYFGGNSDASFPVKFYVDNVTCYTAVPEPSTFALAGLGAAALLIFRRRR